jgi:hypothetical protein
LLSGPVERVGEGPGSARRRRPRAEVPRRRQVVVRFSDAELVLAQERAALAGLAVGAWIGQTAIGVALHGSETVHGLPDLLRLHADVVAVERAARATGAECDEVAELLGRLDAAVDAVVVELDRARR